MALIRTLFCASSGLNSPQNVWDVALFGSNNLSISKVFKSVSLILIWPSGIALSTWFLTSSKRANAPSSSAAITSINIPTLLCFKSCRNPGKPVNVWSFNKVVITLSILCMFLS